MYARRDEKSGQKSILAAALAYPTLPEAWQPAITRHIARTMMNPTTVRIIKCSSVEGPCFSFMYMVLVDFWATGILEISLLPAR